MAARARRVDGADDGGRGTGIQAAPLRVAGYEPLHASKGVEPSVFHVERAATQARGRRTLNNKGADGVFFPPIGDYRRRKHAAIQDKAFRPQ